MNTPSRLCPRLNINEIYPFINIKYKIFFFFNLEETKKRKNFKPSIFKAKFKKTLANQGKIKKTANQKENLIFSYHSSEVVNPSTKEISLIHNNKKTFI